MNTTNLASSTDVLNGDPCGRRALVDRAVPQRWSFIAALDDDAQVRDVERRLARLELPGPNDCDADGR